LFTGMVSTVYLIHSAFLLNNHFYSFFLADNDFISMAEVLNNTLNGKFFKTNYHGFGDSANYLAHHFSPALIFLSPFMILSEYRLGYGYGLIFFNILSLILFSVLLLKKNIRGSGFFFLLSFFLLNLYTYRLFQSYHFESLFLAFFLILLIGIETGNLTGILVGFFLCLFLKEDISIYLSLFGIYIFFFKSRKLGSFFFLFPIFHFFVLIQFVRSFIDSSAAIDWSMDWKDWGTGYAEIFRNTITSPLRIAGIIAGKYQAIIEISLGFGLLFYLYPPMLIVIAPIILLHFISGRLWYNVLYNYYIYSVLPFILYACFKGYDRITSIRKENVFRFVMLFIFSLLLYRNSNDKLFPLHPNRVDLSRANNVSEAVSMITPGKEVSAQFDLSPFIKRKNPVFPIKNTGNQRDYLLFDLNNGFSPYIPLKDLEQIKESSIRKGNYAEIFKRDGVILLYRSKDNLKN
ncbi:MAG: DUF2079 domain-containing protein, partial [Leptospira sp.]|nr:DUF2079 domain-containing protein [Leptospira sp.]